MAARNGVASTVCRTGFRIGINLGDVIVEVDHIDGGRRQYRRAKRCHMANMMASISGVRTKILTCPTVRESVTVAV